MTLFPPPTADWSPERHEQVADHLDTVARDYESRAARFRATADQYRTAAENLRARGVTA